jgi:aspartyl protease family protein
MTADDNASLIYALILLVIVASSLFSRRLPIGQTAKYALAWIGIFAIGFVLFSFRGELGRAWTRVSEELTPGKPITENGTVRIRRGEGGHFHVNALVNGRNVRFMIDSGATTTAVSVGAAKSAGVEVSTTGFPVIVDTANGPTEARRVVISRIVIGGIAREELPVLVSESFGDINLLGMNFLDSLKAWRVEGDEMVLNP